MISWFQGPRGQTANNAIIRGLTPAQIQANTTRGSTPGLIDPARGRAGGRVYLEDEGSGDDTESESSVSGESQDEESDEDEGNGDQEGEEVLESVEAVEEYDSKDTIEGPPAKRRRIGSAYKSATATESTLNHANTVPMKEDTALGKSGQATTVPGETILHTPSRALAVAHDAIV